MAHNTYSKSTKDIDIRFLKPEIPPICRRALFKYEPWYTFNGVNYINDKLINLLHRRNLYVSTRNVPSCLTVRHHQDKSLQRDLVVLGELGFPLEVLDRTNGWEDFFPDVNPIILEGEEDMEFKSVLTEGQKSSLKSLMLGIKSDNPIFRKEMDDLIHTEVAEIEQFEEEPEGPMFSEFNPLKNFPKREKRVEETLKQDLCLRIKEEINPFELWALQNVSNITGREMPRIFSYPGDQLTLKQKLPSYMFGGHVLSKKPIEFHKVSSLKGKMHVLLHYTHWGKRLFTIFQDELADKDEQRWSERLISELNHFLAGKPHPKWDKETTKRLYGDEKRDIHARANRLVHMLTTVNGIMIQKILASPEVKWDWEKYDFAVLGLITLSLQEEFLDGTISEEMMNCPSFYNEVKEWHNTFKLACGTNKVKETCLEIGSTRGLSNKIFLTDFRIFAKLSDEIEIARRRGILSQKRGVGTPPPVEVIRSSEKFITGTTKEVKPLPTEYKKFIHEIAQEACQEIPDECITGLWTKAGINVITGTSCFEKTREEGGNIAAVNDLIFEYRSKKDGKAPIYDLYNMKKTGEIEYQKDNPGTYIFWMCLDIVLHSNVDELAELKLTHAKAPSKIRTVTKSKIAIKIVLDTINGIIAWVLSKAFPTSSSGMEKENHAWNFFKEICKTPWVFEPFTRPEFNMVTPVIKSEFNEFANVYACSTDWSNATDNSDFEVGKLLIGPFLNRIGIPPCLKGIVFRMCLSPRKVYFQNRGFLKKYGKASKEMPDYNYIITKRGIMMGDPVTKITLHLTNICVRKGASKLAYKARSLGLIPADFSQTRKNYT